MNPAAPPPVASQPFAPAGGGGAPVWVNLSRADGSATSAALQLDVCFKAHKKDPRAVREARRQEAVRHSPPPLVLSGHAASLTPYQSDTPRPSPRTNRTRRVPHPVLIGHAASLTPHQRARDPAAAAAAAARPRPVAGPLPLPARASPCSSPECGRAQASAPRGAVRCAHPAVPAREQADQALADSAGQDIPDWISCWDVREVRFPAPPRPAPPP